MLFDFLSFVYLYAFQYASIYSNDESEGGKIEWRKLKCNLLKEMKIFSEVASSSNLIKSFIQRPGKFNSLRNRGKIFHLKHFVSREDMVIFANRWWWWYLWINYLRLFISNDERKFSKGFFNYVKGLNLIPLSTLFHKLYEISLTSSSEL